MGKTAMARRIKIRIYFLYALCGTGVGAEYENCTYGIIENIGTGYCDDYNNNEGCLYDGGDCCQCTSTDDGSVYSDISSSSSFCVDPSSPCYSATAVALQSNCTDGDIYAIGDGWCDEENNNEGCLYDGGDCCQCTSIDDGFVYSDISSSSSFCVDPSSSCYSATAAALQSNCTDGDIYAIEDGWCDEENNNEGCLYDGGDCCQCTSIDDGSVYSDISSSSSFCVDPSSPCYSATSVALQSNCTDGDIHAIGNGWCDDENNNEGCLYDGGDCCQCTGIDDGSDYSDISPLSLFCVNPSSSCYSAVAVALQSNCTDGDIHAIGDGRCDEENNNEGCLYDGGDCCQCTVIDDGSVYSDISSSSSFCVDRSSPCYSATAVALQSNCTNGDIRAIGDEWCDEENNNEGCLYDGGDCCQCTSIDDGFVYLDISPSSSFCVDPSSSCYSTTAVALQSNCTDGDTHAIEDGWCDEENNNEGCLYDGGDCCQCTSIDDGSVYFNTSSSSLFCVDPSSSCYSATAAALQSNCIVENIHAIGNGRCDEENNNEGCLYDGGDCCTCTCVMNELLVGCDRSGQCLDPEVVDLVPYVCEKAQQTLGICADLQREWVVENASDARALTEAVSCSGGSFNVEWKGKVRVDKTISITDGTVINVTGINADSVIDGDWKTRLFSVVNASLHLSNITVSNGSATYGGAIAASRSRLSFTGVSFLGNTATNDGGALHLSNGTSVSFIGETFFLNNTAFNGGAISMIGSSSASWMVNAYFSYNTARSQGGALYLMERSSSIWTAEALFLHNSAKNRGGALCLSFGSSAHWTAETQFLYNSAGNNGGALYLHSSNVDWTAEAKFLYNSAKNIGGGLYLSGSSADWTADAQFLYNSAGRSGGALYLLGSSANWTTEAHFFSNSADHGGALCLISSTSKWTAEAQFLYNNAEDNGGALYLLGSSADWTAEAQFLNNSAGLGGGALYLSRSTSNWNAEAQFVYNNAEDNGGAFYLSSSSADWTAETQFLYNSAGFNGGALYLYSSSADWTKEAQFLNNNAGRDGGALYSQSGSVDWAVEAHFLDNNAGGGGGALYLSSSSAVWIAKVYYVTNSAGGNGGALYVAESSSASWGGENVPFANTSTGSNVSGINRTNWAQACIFRGNSALFNGGGVHVSDNSSLSWSIKTVFLDNTAQNGGGIFSSNTVDVRWTEETNFTSNYAQSSGGAVGLVSANDERPVIVMNGPTSFVKNNCGVNGGAMSLVKPFAVVLESKDVIFVRNSAREKGGAVFTTLAWIGIVFTEVDFVENVARLGGGIHSTESGTEVNVNRSSEQMNNPMTFDRCKFVRNSAFAIGGAVDSASGRDSFVHTLFEGNTARVGGALRLAGIASIDNCSFEQNVSGLGGGPAVSNTGYISNVSNSYFHHNVFKCDAQTFLYFNKCDDPYETVCDVCPPKCFECSFGDGQGSPTCISLLEAGVEHATSKGGNTTVEGLLIHKGYWRATNTSINIFRCFNTKACKGGLTGASGYCVIGYEGPYCSICSKNYASSMRFTCRECSDRTTVIVTATVLLALALVIVIAIVSYMVSTEVIGARGGIIDCVMERVPLQSVKIIIIVWQILTQFTYVANVSFSSVYQQFLDGVNFLNFDLSWVLSAGCLLEIDFHDRLLWTTIMPFVIMGLLGITYAVAMHRNLTSPETAIRHIQHKHVSMALLVIILVYSSVSSVVFQMFACDNLDDGKRYLRADYTIDCDSSKHRVFQIYSSLMILVYPVGIPALYAGMLFSNRHMLQGDVNQERSPVVKWISSLWKPYKPHRFYYEVIECGRRISLTGVIVFIYPNSAAQVAATFAIAVMFIFVSEGMAPYASPWDAWMSRMGQAIIFSTMYLALLLKVNVSGENEASQKMFEAVLVGCHGCMVLAVIVQVVIMAMSFRRERQQEDPRPRIRHHMNSTRMIQACLVEDDMIKGEL